MENYRDIKFISIGNYRENEEMENYRESGADERSNLAKTKKYQYSNNLRIIWRRNHLSGEPRNRPDSARFDLYGSRKFHHKENTQLTVLDLSESRKFKFACIDLT
jgi:hypothetical protein